MTDERRSIAGLTCAEWNPGGSPVVLALHGLTSTSDELGLAAGRAALPRLTSERVGGNHLTVLFDPSLAAAATRA